MKPEGPVGRSNPSMERSAPAAPEAIDELALVRNAAAGDERAFRTLVEAHQQRAYALAFRMLRSTSDAEDATQEAFVRAWGALPRFRGESRFGTWLHRIVARTAIDRVARLKQRRERETGMDALEHMAGSGGGEAEARLTGLKLERLMDGLSPPQRAAVTLFYYEGRPVEEIAEVLGMPTGTVKTHLARARAALRNGWMRDQGVNP